MKRSLDLSVDLLGAAACVALYLGLAVAQIDSPGLYYDEAADAVPAVQILAGQPIDALRGATLSLFGLTLPLMIFDYVGPWNTYLLLPIFQIFGVSVASLRGLTIGAGALTIALAYLFTRDFAGRSVALASTFLLAVSPAFVWWTREGIHVTSILLVFSLGSLVLLLRWYRTGAAAPLIGAAWLLGAGLTAKFLFLWWLVALAASYALLIWLPARLARLRRSGPSVQGQDSQLTPAAEPGASLARPGEGRLANPSFLIRQSGNWGLAVLARPETSRVRNIRNTRPPKAHHSELQEPNSKPETRNSKSESRKTPPWAWPVPALASHLGAGPLI